MKPNDLFRLLGLSKADITNGDLAVYSPRDGGEIALLKTDAPSAIEAKIASAEAAFSQWRLVPPPRRGELIRLFADQLRANKEPLSRLVTLECGKILEEGLGEVQEMIDICDFAVGLSRQLYGLTIASERPGHRMMETWRPLGPTGVITAFNFPVAVWAWNFALACVCGNPVLWKPSEITPLTALACQALFNQALRHFGEAPKGLLEIVIGGPTAGQRLVDDPRLKLISATGSCSMGRQVGERAAARFGRCLLELGGNNAMIVAKTADLSLALRAILFSAAGTAGQRCTTLRRLIVHQDIYDDLVAKLKSAYNGIRIGDPLEAGVLVGPLISQAAFAAMESSLKQAAADGGLVYGGERVLKDRFPNAYYVKPALVEMNEQTKTVAKETFAPILFVLKYQDLNQAINLNNAVPQGLSSCIFTNDLREAEKFISPAGSDCGIVNVNIGPSGAEVGGAFGGEKETGGGRVSGSDAWKNYMSRATNTINYSQKLPLAQGIRFGEGQ